MVTPRRLTAVLALLVVLGTSTVQLVHASSPYCDPYGDPNVYKACVALRASQQQQAQNAANLRQVESEEANTEQAIIDLENLIAHLQDEIVAQQGAIAQTQAKIDALNKQIAALEADIAKRQAYIDQREKLLARRVRAMDMHGQIDYLELIVTATSFTDLLDRIATMQEIIRSDHALLEDLRAERAKVQAERDQLAQQRDALNGLLSAQQAQEEQLAAYQAQEQEALDYEHQHQAELQALQAKLQAAQAAINAQVQQDQQNYAAAAAAAGGGSGRFSWPVRGSYYISQGFGCTDYDLEPYDASCPPQAHYFHAGIDIVEGYGSPIYAADTGIVSLGWDQYGYGQYIVLTHGNGYSTLYGHLSQYEVSDGQTVSRGQLIGLEGSTGNSSGPHLHFGVMLNGSWVNPCAYLVPSC
jgi:murein DD-endopeptidase MepM/ murein hydrolase activator NlpD